MFEFTHDTLPVPLPSKMNNYGNGSANQAYRLLQKMAASKVMLRTDILTLLLPIAVKVAVRANRAKWIFTASLIERCE
ncbi:hypothetical protein VV7356_09450 [Vibrio vulnificus]